MPDSVAIYVSSIESTFDSNPVNGAVATTNDVTSEYSVSDSFALNVGSIKQWANDRTSDNRRADNHANHAAS